PRARRSLSELLNMSDPHVLCNDGTEHHFRKKELRYLSELIEEEEYDLLLLPIILEVRSEQGDIIIHSKHGIEAKLISSIIGMPLLFRDNSLKMFRSQINAVRSVLKTTTQYVFI
ncbi:MAG: DUF61 family protein, partial [Deltaproteobacteria bacterium]|nr:DUF61 family protein [Deltaproteobacteria bacterium]